MDIVDNCSRCLAFKETAESINGKREVADRVGDCVRRSPRLVAGSMKIFPEVKADCYCMDFKKINTGTT